MDESRRLAGEAIQRLKREQAALERQRRDDEAKLRRLSSVPAKNGELARLVEVQDRIAATERRLAEVENELTRSIAQDINEPDVAAALAEFDTLLAALTPREQVQVLRLLVERIDHDGRQGNIDITFRPAGIKALAAKVAEHEETAA